MGAISVVIRLRSFACSASRDASAAAAAPRPKVKIADRYWVAAIRPLAVARRRIVRLQNTFSSRHSSPGWARTRRGPPRRAGAVRAHELVRRVRLRSARVGPRRSRRRPAPAGTVPPRPRSSPGRSSPAGGRRARRAPSRSDVPGPLAEARVPDRGAPRLSGPPAVAASRTAAAPSAIAPTMRAIFTGAPLVSVLSRVLMGVGSAALRSASLRCRKRPAPPPCSRRVPGRGPARGSESARRIATPRRPGGRRRSRRGRPRNGEGRLAVRERRRLEASLLRAGRVAGRPRRPSPSPPTPSARAAWSSVTCVDGRARACSRSRWRGGSPPSRGARPRHLVRAHEERVEARRRRSSAARLRVRERGLDAARDDLERVAERRREADPSRPPASSARTPISRSPELSQATP